MQKFDKLICIMLLYNKVLDESLSLDTYLNINSANVAAFEGDNQEP